MKTGILLSKTERIFDFSFYLAFTPEIFKIVSSIVLNSIIGSSSPPIFVFLIFTFVKICQNLSFESVLSNFLSVVDKNIPKI